MATKWYLCAKCSTLVKQDSTPSSLHCPSSGNHQWTALAEVGTTNYQCKKCGTTIQAKAMPTSLHCPASGNHQWHKL